MFCPKCGNSRKTSGQRFCTRCGLNLALPRLQAQVARHAAPTLRILETPSALNTTTLASYVGSTQPVSLPRPTTLEAQGLAKTATARTASKQNVTLFWLSLLVFPVALVLGFKPSLLSGHAQNLQLETVAPVVLPMATNHVAALPTPTATPMSEIQLAEWSVLADETRQTSQLEKALNATGEATTEIAPGGQLALAYTAGKSFFNGPGPDVQISGPANERVSYTVFVRATPTSIWQRIDFNRASLPTGGKGHDMGHHGLQQASQLLIHNDADAPLRIGVISARYHKAVAVQPPHVHRYQPALDKHVVPDSPKHDAKHKECGKSKQSR